jgi:hypothetical protein
MWSNFEGLNLIGRWFNFHFFTSLDRLSTCLTFSYVSIVMYFLSAMLAHGPSMLLDTIHIGHETCYGY